MSEQTPERLKNFRAAYTSPAGSSRSWFVAQTGIILAGFCGVFVLLAFRGGSNPEQDSASAQSAPDRKLASYLAEKGMPGDAIDLYGRYLDTAALPPEERANVCFTVARLALESENFETALRYLYEAEFYNEDESLKSEIDKSVLACLEHLDRSESLRRELRNRSSLDTTKIQDSGASAVLAEFGDQKITVGDLDMEIEKLPPSVRETVQTPAQKTEFLKNLVAERLLVNKAFRLGLDKDPAMQEQVSRQLESLMVRKLINQEVERELRVTDDDVRRFYEAEIDRFTDPARVTGALGSGATEEHARAAAGDNKTATNVTVIKGQALGASLDPGVAAKLLDAVDGADPGKVEAVFQLGDVWYCFVGNSTEERVRTFEAVRDQAESMYHNVKEQELVQSLIEETIRLEDAKLYPERLKENVP